MFPEFSDILQKQESTPLKILLQLTTDHFVCLILFGKITNYFLISTSVF